MRINHAVILLCYELATKFLFAQRVNKLIKFTSFKSDLSDGNAKKISIFFNVLDLVELRTFARQQKF